MSDMKLVETKMLPNAIHMRFADDFDLQMVDYWIDFQVHLDGLTVRTIWP